MFKAICAYVCEAPEAAPKLTDSLAIALFQSIKQDIDDTVGLFKGTNEYAYTLADGASRFMGRDIIINEHCSNDVVYIVDPKELYVRFAMPPAMEVDRSSGFLSATTTMRCLTVVDFAWNPAACIKVAKATA